LDCQLTPNDRTALTDAAGGRSLTSIVSEIVAALDPDRQVEAARAFSGGAEPNLEQITKARTQLLAEASKPIAANPKLRNLIVAVKKSYEQIIDTISQDRVLEAGPAEAVRERALRMVQTFEQFLQTHKDEIEVLQILYSKPYAVGLSLKDIKSLADMIEKPMDGSPRATRDQLWHAYERLDGAHVRGRTEVAADLVNLVRFALHQREELTPRRTEVEDRFAAWLDQQKRAGVTFTADEMRWLEAIRDHIASSLAVEADDFDLDPFIAWGGLGKAQQVFGERFFPLLSELNEVLAA
jgi:type I restriction enzyme R subunit